MLKKIMLFSLMILLVVSCSSAPKRMLVLNCKHVGLADEGEYWQCDRPE